MTGITQVKHRMDDTYFCACVSFKILQFTISVSDKRFSTALYELSEKQRSVILLHYFQTMSAAVLPL